MAYQSPDELVADYLRRIGKNNINALTYKEATELLDQMRGTATYESPTASYSVSPEETDVGKELLRIQGETKNVEIADEQKRLSDQAEFERRVQEESLKRQEADLAKKFSDIFGRVEAGGTERIGRQFVPARQKLISEEAALGRLRSPVSIVPLSKLEEQKQNAISSFLGDVASQRASGEFDLAKSIEAVLQGEREAERQSTRFGQELGLRREQLLQERQIADANRALSERLGIAQLRQGDKSKSWVDQLESGLGIASSVVGLGKGLFGGTIGEGKTRRREGGLF